MQTEFRELKQEIAALSQKVDEVLRILQPIEPHVLNGSGLLTIEQVAKHLQKSRRHVERLVKLGRLRKVPNLGKRTTRFRPMDLAALVAGGRENLPGALRL